MISYLWFTFLYQPLLNALIWIYSAVAGQNLGWAVVYLTIGLRLALLPLTIVGERNSLRHRAATREATEAMRAHRGDPIAQREVARSITKKYKISPWAKVVVLGIQAVVIVLLYQVFVGGITGDKITRVLYPGVEFPGRLNTMFYGFDIGQRHSIVWPLVVAVYFIVSILLENRSRPSWEKSEAAYLVLWPLVSFAILWYLPLVKSLFILTTMLFSDMIHLLRWLVVKEQKIK